MEDGGDGLTWTELQTELILYEKEERVKQRDREERDKESQRWRAREEKQKGSKRENVFWGHAGFRG